MNTTKLLKYFWKLRYLVLHEIAEFGYCFTLIWNSTKVKLKHFIWDFLTKKIGSSLPKYSVVNKLWEATEKVLREDNICAKSFARTGLFSWNEQASNKLKLMPATVFKKIEHPEQLDDPLLAEQLDTPFLAEKFDDPPFAEQLDDPLLAEQFDEPQ